MFHTALLYESPLFATPFANRPVDECSEAILKPDLERTNDLSCNSLFAAPMNNSL